MENEILLCSDCFKDQGLRLNAYKLGIKKNSKCPQCKSKEGKKLTLDLINTLSYRFFVRGTFQRTEYGGAPLIQCNNLHESQIEVAGILKHDITLIENAANLHFFYYGPRLWMVGLEIQPLESLHSVTERGEIIEQIIHKYPAKTLTKGDTFYRLRKNPVAPKDILQYDTPPISGKGRLDSATLPILYASQDIEVCVHECRVTVEDELYLATLSPASELKILDLTELIAEDSPSEFESLDIAVHMLFSAGSHSYDISREIAVQVNKAGFDGMIYPSYFSTSKTGATPFETIYGISIRKFPHYSGYAKSQVIPNLALFGNPIKDRKVMVKNINKITLNKIEYDIIFGPVEI